MSRFLAIFHGGATDEERDSVTPEDRSTFLARWSAWANTVGDNLVDPGAPLYHKVRITAGGAEQFEDAKVAYAIINAGSHDQAVEMFSTHPHLSLASGNSIEVIECPAPPS